MEQLGKRVLELRKKAGLTQDELGQRIGIKYASVSAIERGGGTTTKVLEKLSREFDVSMDYLVTGRENSNPVKEESLLVQVFDELRGRLSFLESQLTTKDRQIEFQNRMLEKLGKSESYMGDAAAGKERRGFQKAKNQILEPVKAFAKVA